jgi:transposase-like protein
MENREYPMTFDEFISRFATEEQCRDYLFGLRFPNGFVCPKCGNEKSWLIKGVLYECSTCGKQTSVTAGTVFQDTRTSLRTWFVAIWWITTQKTGASAMGLQQVLGLKTYKTAWTWLHKIRKAMVHPDRDVLSGIVEVDEAYVGGEEIGGKKGRGTENKALVAVAVELKDNRGIGRARIEVVSDATKESLQGFVKRNVSVGSTIVTDGWASYTSLPKEGYGHIVKISGKKSADEDTDEPLPHVHMIISLLKRWLLGTHQGAVSKKHLQAYLDEYVFRFNRRKSARRGLLFYRLLECAMMLPATTYEELVDEPI